MSKVFVAEERALGRRVVIKVLPPDMAEIMSAERFAREMRLAARLQHPNIVPVLTSGVIDRTLPYYTMPFVAGESLRAALSPSRRLVIPRIVAILSDVGRALAFAHGEGVVHRDIKPENILLAGDVAVVTDFGIAKAVNDTAHTTVRQDGHPLTNVGTSVGTPHYMAPEQIVAESLVDHRADIYSLGVVAYELLAGRLPFGDRGLREGLAAQLAETPGDVRLSAAGGAGRLGDDRDAVFGERPRRASATHDRRRRSVEGRWLGPPAPPPLVGARGVAATARLRGQHADPARFRRCDRGVVDTSNESNARPASAPLPGISADPNVAGVPV